jgi:molecular chaperone DnaK (HSP70)
LPYSLGVDLGTSFVAAAIARPSGVGMVSLSAQSVVAPALVYLDEDGTISTGDAARRRAVTGPDRVGREFKRRLGDPTPITLGHESYAVTELLGALLRDVLRHVTRLEREPPEQVVLTHPANWGPFRRGLFEEVPAIAELSNAELSNIVTITEPEAAAAHYAAARCLHDGQIVGVYDLGGGTFDATILRGGPDGVEILGRPEGIERLGGADFDESVLEYVNYSTGGALDALDMTDPHTARAVARLRQDCVLAKESLSHDTETTIPVFLPDRHFEVTLTRSDFEDMVRGPIESTTQALVRTLRAAALEPSDLSAVLLVGGSSRIPLVAELVGQALGCRTLVDTHPKFTVALGAAATTLRRHRVGATSATVAPGIAPAGAMAEPAAVATSARARASVAAEPVHPLERDLPAGSPPAHAAPPNTRNWVLALSIATIVLVAFLVIV